jgi:hypothetical protein
MDQLDYIVMLANLRSERGAAASAAELLEVLNCKVNDQGLGGHPFSDALQQVAAQWHRRWDHLTRG